MDDLDVNMAVWGIFLKTTLQAAVHLGQDYDANLRFVKNHLWNSVKQLFNETGKLIRGQTKITGISTNDFKDLTWMSTSSRWMWTDSRRDLPEELPKVLERARTPKLGAGTVGRMDIERPSATGDRKVLARAERKVRRKATAKVPEKARRVRRQMLQVRQVGAHVERLQVQEDECVQIGRGRALIGEWMLRHGEHRFECAGDGVSGSVPVDSGRRLHRAKDSRQSIEFQASVGQAFCLILVRERCKSNSKMSEIRTEL